MPYTKQEKEIFLSNGVSYNKEKKHYYCYFCNKYIIKPLTHSKTEEHNENKEIEMQ